MGGQRRTIEQLKARGKTLTVRVAKAVRDEIKRAAKETFPNEYLGFLIGRKIGDQEIEVYDLHHGAYDTHPDSVSWGAFVAGRMDAKEHAREIDSEVVGWVHSHPYPNTGATMLRCDLSEDDIANGSDGLMAICAVSQSANNRLTARVRFHPPFDRVREVYV